MKFRSFFSLLNFTVMLLFPYYTYYDLGSLVLVFKINDDEFLHHFVMYKFHFVSDLPF